MDVRVLLSNSQYLSTKRWTGEPISYFEFHGNLFSIDEHFKVELVERHEAEGFSDEKVQSGSDNELSFVREKALLAKIAEMPEPDRAMAKRLHAIIRASAPTLAPKTWYGMPAYGSKEGKGSIFTIELPLN